MNYDKDKFITFDIKVSNISIRHANRIMGLLKTMQKLGGVGASRRVVFYCDGDGDFRPKFEFENPKYDEKYEKDMTNKRVIGFQPKGSQYIPDDEDDPFYN